ncbi:MAG: tripartite tricarboxylate transporter permease [Nanoarchaeota archaeon]
MISILFVILLGCIAGTITGIIPGIHINLVATIILAGSPFLATFVSPLLIAIFIISMAITHTFTDFLPSCFLGAPDSDTVLSVLPGHKYLLSGKGYEAVFLTVVGSIFGLLLTILFTPIIIPFLRFIYPILQNYIGYILIVVVLLMVLREKTKIWPLITFLLSGALGIIVFNIATLKDPLLPMLSGLFGVSVLFLSYKDNVKIPQQKITRPEIDKRTGIKAISSSVAVGSIASFFPGISPAHAAIIATQIVRRLSTAGFLILVGSLNTVNMVVSMITLYTIDKARNGAIVIMSEILETFNLDTLILLIGVSLVAGLLATIITLKLSKIFSSLITRVNYQKLCIAVMVIIMLVVAALTGFMGIFVLVVSTLIGIIPALKGIGRNHLMGCLLLPVILYYIL